MESLSGRARFFILAVCLIGGISVVGQLLRFTTLSNWPLLLSSCAIATLLQILKMEGFTARTSYNLSWIVYGFAYTYLGVPSAILVMVVSHLGEWFWYRYRWYIQCFNIATFGIAFTFASVIQGAIQSSGVASISGVPALIVAFSVLTVLNHLLVGAAVYWARGQTFAQSGVLDPLSVLVDIGMLCVGALTAIAWTFEPSGIILVILMVFLMYRALKVPSLQRKTEIDPKTDVYNVGYFNAKIDKAITDAQQDGRSLFVIMADLDHLRDVNNRFGHLAGDLVIKGAASILKRHSGDDGLVARFGGEEFVILLQAKTLAEVEAIVETMRAEIEGAVFDSADASSPVRATMSFGIAEFRAGESTASQDLINRADEALYESKRLGRNRACVYAKNETSSQPHLKASQPGTNTATQEQSVHARTPMEGEVPDSVPLATDTHDTARNTYEWKLILYISCLTMVSSGLALFMPWQVDDPDWQGILLFAALAASAEFSNLEIYARQTSVSTSAAPLLAGTLLFGPYAATVIGLAIAGTAWAKYRSPWMRFWFNANNHVIGGMICAAIVMLIGMPLESWSFPLQAAFTLVCGLILYIITTFQVAGAVALSEGRSWYGVWHERFRWLGLHYVALAIVSIGLIASYRMVGMIGVGIILLPLVILRYSHKQYIDHTETLVGVLQQKNAKLYRQNQEIEILNAEMLDLIAAMLDLRDSSVQNHSSQVALYATEIAKQMGMSGAQIDQVRKAALLHDVGKLAIPESLLNKPATLNEAEYELVKRHPDIGAALLNDFHSFRSIVEFVRHHHERYDGSGYPAGQVGAEIPLEARILGLADAVEAMASARPYHQAMPVAGIRAELSRCSGTQFDPVVVEAFLRVLEQRGDQIIIDSSPQRLVTGFRTSSVHSNSH